MTLGFISTGNSDIWMIWISSQVATGNNTGEIEIRSPYWFPTASSHDYQAVLSLQNLCHHLLLERAETRVTKILLFHKRKTTPKLEDMEMNAEFLNPKIFTSKNQVIDKCWWQVHKLLVWFWSPYSDALLGHFMLDVQRENPFKGNSLKKWGKCWNCHHTICTIGHGHEKGGKNRARKYINNKEGFGVKNKSRFCNPSLFEMKSTKGFFESKVIHIFSRHLWVPQTHQLNSHSQIFAYHKC